MYCTFQVTSHIFVRLCLRLCLYVVAIKPVFQETNFSLMGKKSALVLHHEETGIYWLLPKHVWVWLDT